MAEKKGTALLILQLFAFIETSTIREHILDWWKDVSQMKPMDCKLNPKHLNSYPANAQDLISSLLPTIYFSLHSCLEGSNINRNYHFNGRSFEHNNQANDTSYKIHDSLISKFIQLVLCTDIGGFQFGPFFSVFTLL